MKADLRETLLLEALTEIPFSGISDASLTAAAERVGASPVERDALFPDGPASLVEAFSHWADAQMAERMRLAAPERMRERIAKAVRSRIEALAPHKEAARRAAAFLALPTSAPLAARLLVDSVDAMWRAAGDRSSDFSYYTKRALLAGVYGSTLIYWFTDSSEDNAESWAFLDSRIDDVMQIQKLRANVEEAVAKLPDPFGVLATLKGTTGSRQ
jgi:ubiquinone biosynthesis protein COQ9